MDLGERIKFVRKELGLNQSDFGRKISISQSTIAGYESGTRAQPDAILKLICTTYNVDYKWLKYGNGYGPFVQPQNIEKQIDQLMPQQSKIAKIIMAEACRVLDDHAWEKFGEMIRAVAQRLKEEHEKEAKEEEGE